MDILLNVIRILCHFFTFAIFFRAIMSWFSPIPTNRLAYLLYQATEPILAPLRRIIPRAGMIDFTPLAAIIILQLIANLTYLAG